MEKRAMQELAAEMEVLASRLKNVHSTLTSIDEDFAQAEKVDGDYKVVWGEVGDCLGGVVDKCKLA